MDEKGSQLSVTEQSAVLQAFSKALDREAHVLTRHPDLLWQQMYNRLQWEDGKQKDGSVSKVITPVFKSRASPGTKTWFHNKCRVLESDAFIRILKGHTQMVNSCAFSPDGRTLASASGNTQDPYGQDYTLRLWDARTGAEQAVLKGHTAQVISCAFSPDGRTVASASGDGTLRLWDARSGAEQAVLNGHTATVISCAFSPDGRTLASASWDNTLRLWDAKTGKKKKVLKGHTNIINSCAFSPDGRILASASWDKTVRLWDARSGELQAVLEGHTERVNSCAFSPDGRTLASASSDNTVRLWDANSGEQQAVLEGHTERVNSCAFSPDGRTLASVSLDNTVRLWDANSGELIDTFYCIGYVRDCAFNPSGEKLAAGDSGGNVYILEWFGREAKPIIATATKRAQDLVARCPACRQEHAVKQEQLGSELTCPSPGCGLRMRLNPFTIQPPAKTMPPLGWSKK